MNDNCDTPVTPHFWLGVLPVAFVFSVPGRREKELGKPVAGATGDNLDAALKHLHSALPTIFQSPDRYQYRITNSYPEPIAKSLRHSSTQPRDGQVVDPANAERVLADLKGCHTVILCGQKPQLLFKSVRSVYPNTICASHLSNQSLNRKYKGPDVTRLTVPQIRRKKRVELWANDVLQSLD